VSQWLNLGNCGTDCNLVDMGRPRQDEMVLFDPGAVAVTRHRWRGDIPSPWNERSRPTA